MHRLFHSRLFWLLSIMLGIFYLLWSVNVAGMSIGFGKIRTYRYGYWLFAATPLLATAAIMSFLVTASLLVKGHRSRNYACIEMLRPIVVWIGAIGTVFVLATLIGIPLGSTQRDIRLA